MTFHQAQAAQYAQQLNRLSLVAEIPSPQPQHIPPPEVRGGSRRNSIYDQDEIGTQASNAGSRRGSDAEKYGPIRRRSLLQHGIATRPTAFMDTDPRRSLPSQVQAAEALQSSYHSQPNPTPAPPIELPVLGPNPAFIVPGPRTETPTDLDYRHTGTLKFGSLRITNGAASPTPSRDGRANSLGAEEDYTVPGQARKSIEKEKRHGLSHRSHTLSVPAEARKAPWVVTSESPLRQAHGTEFEPLTINIPDPEFPLFDFKSTEVLFKSTHSPTKSLELAHEYQQEIALSPFSFDNSPLPSPRIESTSKHTAIEDDLFAPEPNTPNLEATPRMPRSFDSGYEGGPVRKPKGPREKDPKPLAKADSGYSSIVSLRSFKKDNSPAAPLKDGPPTPIHETFHRVPSSTYSVNSSIGPETTLRSKRSLPALPVEEVVKLPSEPTSKAPPVPLKEVSHEKLTPLPYPVLQKSIEQTNNISQAQPHLQVPKKTSRRKSLPAVANAAREMREDSPADSEKSVASSGSSSIWQRKKLNKRASRPSSFQPQPEPVFTVQAFRSPSEVHRIPIPPADVRRHLDERVESFPVASFPNTTSGFTQLRRTASKETLGTIFSVGSAEVRDELNFARLQGALPAIPKEATIEEDPSPASDWVPRPDFNKRHTYQASTPMPAPEPERVARKSFQAPVARDRSRDHVLAPSKSRESFQKPPARNPSPAPSKSRDSLQKQPIRNPSPAPSKSRESFQKPPVRNPSPAPTQDWAPRKSLSRPASRDPSPASRAPLRPDFETHVTSYESISSSLGRSSYELALNAIPGQAKPSVNERARTMTQQNETESAQRFAGARNLSQESQASTIVRPRRSYESISNSNPFSGDNRSQNSVQSRGSLRGPPPSAHARYSQQTMLRESLPSYGGKFSNNEAYTAPNEPQRHTPLRYQKPKTGPPVSMAMQRAAIPISNVAPPSRSQLMPQQALNRAPPQPPADSQPKQDPIAAGWTKMAGAWAERKKSAGEALSARKSMEMIRPAATRSSFQQPRAQPQQQELRGRKSMDANTFGTSMQRAGSARPSAEYARTQILRGGKSFDTSQQQQRQTSWNSTNGYDNLNLYGQQPQYYDQEEYNHTYGSAEFSHHDKENFAQHQYDNQEYYEPESEQYHDQRRVDSLPESIHQRKTSTSEMLVLDRFSGGLGYGYEPGLGLVGSAGVRTTGKMGNAGKKSVRESMQYGVDFSDVPVILQRVRVRS